MPSFLFGVKAVVFHEKKGWNFVFKTLVQPQGRLQIIRADGGCLGTVVKRVKQLRLGIVRRWDNVKGFKVLPRCWAVERTFGWRFESRRLCSDYEVRLDRSEALVLLCVILIMVRQLATISVQVAPEPGTLALFGFGGVAGILSSGKRFLSPASNPASKRGAIRPGAIQGSMAS